LSCQLCAAGKYANNSRCFPCPAGSSTSSQGSLNCSLCSAGSYSASGELHCTLCDEGKYASERGQSSCRECSGETYASGMGETTCHSCGPSYSAINHSSCKLRGSIIAIIVILPSLGFIMILVMGCFKVCGDQQQQAERQKLLAATANPSTNTNTNAESDAQDL